MDRFRLNRFNLDSTTLGIAAAVVAAIVVIILAARGGRGPAPAPERLQAEPTITLFDHRSGETKRIKLEEYVAGVVGGEIKNDWPRKALEAQALLARTFTLKKISQGKTRHGTDASTDPEEFQAYSAENVNDAIRQAVQNTRGQVITYNGDPIRAWFHSCAGGITATAQEGLEFNDEPTPYIAVVKDPPCADPAKDRWSAIFSKDEIIAAARKMGTEVGDFNSLRISDRGPSGRATRITIGDAGVSAPGLRTALGPERMRSTLLTTLTVQGDKVRMDGRGWGHGVGMSQFGALDKARRGWNAERIVKYYFRDVEITQRWR